MPPLSYLVGTAAVTENLLKRKWSITILRHLDEGVTDPVEIAKREVDLSLAAMNERLRNMLRFGLIVRYPRPAASKMVEYRLTTRGQKILNVLNIIEQLDQNDGPNGTGQSSGQSRARISAQTKKRLILKD